MTSGCVVGQFNPFTAGEEQFCPLPRGSASHLPPTVHSELQGCPDRKKGTNCQPRGSPTSGNGPVHRASFFSSAKWGHQQSPLSGDPWWDHMGLAHMLSTRPAHWLGF